MNHNELKNNKAVNAGVQEQERLLVTLTFVYALVFALPSFTHDFFSINGVFVIYMIVVLLALLPFTPIGIKFLAASLGIIMVVKVSLNIIDLMLFSPVSASLLMFGIADFIISLVIINLCCRVLVAAKHKAS